MLKKSVLCSLAVWLMALMVPHSAAAQELKPAYTRMCTLGGSFCNITCFTGSDPADPIVEIKRNIIRVEYFNMNGAVVIVYLREGVKQTNEETQETEELFKMGQIVVPDTMICIAHVGVWEEQTTAPKAPK